MGCASGLFSCISRQELNPYTKLFSRRHQRRTPRIFQNSKVAVAFLDT
jgi:hypothetical protein